MRLLYELTVLAGIIAVLAGLILPFFGVLNEGLYTGSEKWFDLAAGCLLFSGPLAVVFGINGCRR
jgi:uncharacterized membrane protein